MALAVAAAVILVLVGALVLRSSDNSEELRADIPPPTDTIAPVADDAVFDFSRHDLCAWLSDADVASFVASEIADAGSVEASWQPEESRSEPYTSCSWWLVTDDMGAGELVISDASAWTNFDGEPYVHPFDHEVVPYSYVADAQRYPEDPGWIPIGAAVSGHFALSTDAVVHNGGFGQYAFWSWERQGHVQVDLGLDGPVPSHELFGVADLVLRDLGWIE